MAEEVEYSSRADHKLKYEDQAPPPPPSSSSSSVSTDPIISQSSSSDLTQHPSSPPPVDEIHLANQKVAQEINNGGGGTNDSNEFTSLGQQQIPSCSITTNTTQVEVVAGSSKEIIHVPIGMLCVILGRSGEIIKALQIESGAKIKVTKDIDSDPNSGSKAIELVGTPDQISKVKKLIMDDLVAVNETMSNYYTLDELMESK